MQRNSNSRNSFLPLISGTAEVTGGIAALGQPDTGSSVQLTMRLQVFVGIFLLVWLSGVSFACLAVVLSRPGPVGLIPFGMLAFGLLLTSISFRIEADKAESFFKDLLLLTPASD